MNFIQASFPVETQLGILTRPSTNAEQNISEFKQYYSGFQNVRLTKRQKEYLKCDSEMANSFVNISKMVPNIILDRLAIVPNGNGIIAVDDMSSDYADEASRWWLQRGVDKFATDLHRFVLRDGVAALFVEWINDMPLFTPKPIWTGPREGGVRFHSESDTVDTEFGFCSYQWPVQQYTVDGGEISDTLTRLNLYNKSINEDGGSLIYRFKSTDGQSWTPLTEDEIFNELGIRVNNPQELPISEIPIIKFVNTGQLSEIADIFRLQQLVNKSVGDIDIGADYHAFPLLAADEFPNAENQKIEPGVLIRAKNVKRIEPANLEMVWNGTTLKYVDMVSLVKRWPMWLLNPREFSVPSGTALRVAERPLISQIREKQNSLSPQWRLALNVARQWNNVLTTNELAGDINIKWQPAATENVIEDNRLVVETAKLAGIPDETIWRQSLGFSTNQIKSIQAAMINDPDAKEQQARIILTLSQALIDLEAAGLFAGLEPDQAEALASFGNAEPRIQTGTETETENATIT